MNSLQTPKMLLCVGSNWQLLIRKSLRLLVLPELLLVSHDLYLTVLADGPWYCLEPIGRTFTHQICSQ
jgi:hypothetical protein